MIELVNEMVIEQFLNDFLVSRSEEFGLLVDTFDRISVRLNGQVENSGTSDI